MNTQREFRNILLCDDDEDDCFFFKDALNEVDSKLNVTTVNSGDELLAVLTNGTLPDLLFLDLNMPRKNGRECLTQIRQNDKYLQLPVVIYSTSAVESEVEASFTIGANLFIQKSNNFSDFKKTISKILDSSKISLLNPKEKFVIQNGH